jgi:hypothetical protein
MRADDFPTPFRSHPGLTLAADYVGAGGRAEFIEGRAPIALVLLFSASAISRSIRRQSDLSVLSNNDARRGTIDRRGRESSNCHDTNNNDRGCDDHGWR